MQIRILVRLLSHKKLNYYMKNVVLNGNGNKPDFSIFLHKLVQHRSLALPFEPFRFRLGIRGDQGVTQRCHLSWLTNSALVLYMSPNAGERENCGVSANEYTGLPAPLPEALWTILRGSFLNEGQTQLYN